MRFGNPINANLTATTTQITLESYNAPNHNFPVQLPNNAGGGSTFDIVFGQFSDSFPSGLGTTNFKSITIVFVNAPTTVPINVQCVTSVGPPYKEQIFTIPAGSYSFTFPLITGYPYSQLDNPNPFNPFVGGLHFPSWGNANFTIPFIMILTQETQVQEAIIKNANLSVTVSNFPANQNVTVTGQPIGVTVSNFPATQPVSITGQPISVSVGNFPVSQHVTIDGQPISVSVSGTANVAITGQPIEVMGGSANSLSSYDVGGMTVASHLFTANGTATLLAAPASGHQTRIKWICIDTGGGNSEFVTYKLGTNFFALIYSIANGLGTVPFYEVNNVCTNQAISVTLGNGTFATNQNVYVYYDTITTPVIF